ncbi:response regulator [Polyangium aurulentum]|uniref:response regulator n=1 Tax=Polyangium aurulentum TaxID=2567896 RepID=UPI0010AE2A10|nr:response regulator [Polyangium aurulentum]UQA55585.1 response regulator [Polyangium aurulentum]
MTEPSPLVLLVEDEPQMRRFLRALLDSHGYRVVEAQTARDAIAEATARAPELVLLDLGLPDGDGIEVTRRLREWSRTPIIVISARGREADKIEALDAGADDYLTKPFGAGELLARLRVAMRHAHHAAAGAPESVIEIGDVRVDLARRQVLRGGAEVHLTPLEYKLVAVLAQNAGKVVTHRQLLREVWGPGHVEQPHYLRVYMGQIRHKLEADPARPRFFLTEPGVGYRLKTE